MNLSSLYGQGGATQLGLEYRSLLLKIAFWRTSATPKSPSRREGSHTVQEIRQAKGIAGGPVIVSIPTKERRNRRLRHQGFHDDFWAR